MLHAVLSKLPRPLNLEALLAKTTRMMDQHPPESLPGRGWQTISRYSVLKTARDTQCICAQSENDGENLYRKQAAQLRRLQVWAEMRRVTWKQRRPAASFTVALLVALLSWYLRQNHVTAWDWVTALFKPIQRRVFRDM